MLWWLYYFSVKVVYDYSNLAHFFGTSLLWNFSTKSVTFYFLTLNTFQTFFCSFQFYLCEEGESVLQLSLEWGFFGLCFLTKYLFLSGGSPALAEALP